MIIPFAEWLPDIPAFRNPGATVATNAVPEVYGYSPFKALSVFTNALTERALGAVSAVDASGNTLTFAGDDDSLYRLTNATWADVSKAGSPPIYTTDADGRWEFATYQDTLIATNLADAMQAWTLGSSSAFADLAASAPKARHIAIIRDFVVVGYVDDSGVIPYRVQWSPVGNPAGTWTASGDATTQADAQDLGAGGAVQGIVGGEFGSVFCESAIYRMTYVGPPTVFQFDQVVRGRGLAARGTLASIGNLAFFLTEDGFYGFDGQTATPIGLNKVDQFFLNDVNSQFYNRISATVDPTRKLYMVSYPSSSSQSGLPDKILVYNWGIRQWGLIEEEVELIATLQSAGFTLEQLDNISASIDALPSSLDSRDWAGGAFILGGFDSTHKLGQFGGSQKSATLETGEFQPFAPQGTFVRGARPLVDGERTDTTVQIGTRALQTDSVTWGSAMTPNSRTGLAAFRSNARFQRGRANISNDNWSQAQGLDVDAVASDQA